MPSPDLTLDALTRRFPEGAGHRTVLDGASATVAGGTFAVLFGRSGSGKSTLLNLIAGIDLPTSGRVLLGDTDLTALDERERTLVRRRRIGFVFQQFNLIPTLTVGENVRLPLDLVGRRDDGRSARLLDQVGLADRAGAFPDTLSGGEQQRVAIARALAHDPDLILADEPTGNLDRATADRVLDLLQGLARDEGKTLLVVTHDPGIAARAGRVLTLRDGRLEDGGWKGGESANGAGIESGAAPRPSHVAGS
jgi:putative ABC transport system ATP-binding protein